ncbi:MAG: hypothetical protein FD174_3042 [Geobacteraceae bacterium]|nr:MAG: hypothetical protein FD174_3042 [Geobacteraceae bacterium]
MRGLLFVFAMLLTMPSTGRAEDAASPPAEKINPHGDKGKCEICHVASEEDLNSWFTFSSTKKKLHKDFNALCRQCHGVEFGHGIGKPTKMNLEALPMDAEGKIACAVTCHNVHVKNGDPEQARYYLRLSKDRLCLSCHKK